MSLVERYGQRRAGAGSEPFAPTCPHYSALPGERRCRSFGTGGACTRPDELMCVEWLKANDPERRVRKAEPEVKPEAPPKPEPAPEILRDLFGHPIKPPPPPKAKHALAPPMKRDTRPSPRPTPVPVVRNVTDADVASFKERGVAVRLGNDVAGDVWIVPSYTGADRVEISIEHAALIAAVGSVFPGANVVAMERIVDQPGGGGDDDSQNRMDREREDTTGAGGAR